MSANTPTLEQPSTPSEGGCGFNMPPPAKEHAWLQRFVGDWDAEIEAFTGPDKPPMKSKGRCQVRALGGLWIIEEGHNEAMRFSFVYTLGFDPEKNKFVASWTDTMFAHLWTYEGTVDATGNVLTMETEGPFPMTPGKHARFRDVTTFKTPDHRVYTSSIQQGAEWVPMMTVNLRRKD